jgi:hypothetical protein
MQIQPRTDKAAVRAKVLRGEPVTAQEVFDVAVEGVILQGRPSINPGGKTASACKYRMPSGAACSAGQVWPDELYTPDMEGRSIGILSENDRFPDSLVDHVHLLKDLQYTHDGAATFSRGVRRLFLEEFRRRARAVANNYDLTTPPLAADPNGAPADAR